MSTIYGPASSIKPRIPIPIPTSTASNTDLITYLTELNAYIIKYNEILTQLNTTKNKQIAAQRFAILIEQMRVFLSTLIGS